MFTPGQHIQVIYACEVGLDYVPHGLRGVVVKKVDVLGVPIFYVDFVDGRRLPMRAHEISPVEEATEL